ncbi:MAG: DUF4249 domain-containing protein [Thermotogota bacterium]
MLNKLVSFIFFTLLIVVQGCQEEIDMQTIEFEESLVVDGSITNEPGPYTVKISLSSRLDKPEFSPYTDCNVTIHEKSGESEVLKENKPGVYQTEENGIQGEVGHEYKLTIKTPNGSMYETDYITIIQPVKIKEINTKKYSEQADSKNGMLGYQFYISTAIANKAESYFLWEMEETYEYTSDFPLYGIMEDGVMDKPKDRYKYYRCWKTQPVKQVFTANTLNLEAPVIKDLPLNFVSNQSKRLQYRYSMLVKQYTINKETYTYWNSMEELHEENNFINTQQPFQLRGNVYNSNNTDEAMLGYFKVASVDKKRLFVNYEEELDTDPCNINFDLTGLHRMSYSKSVYLGLEEDGRYGIVNKECVDCRLKGGKLTPPEFWYNE